jgi:GEVED domain/Secretion system C-terminal sorting domain
MTFGTPNDHDYILAWLDWNNNGIFDTNEQYNLTPQYLQTAVASLNIIVPTSAMVSKVKMRIRSIWNDSNTLTSSSPCGSLTYGEVEDYTLNITNAIQALARETTTPSTKNQSFDTVKMTAFPNPTTGILDINFNNNTDFTVDVLDMVGRTILSKTLTNGSGQVDLSGFSKGIYFIKSRKLGVQTMKIVLQ